MADSRVTRFPGAPSMTPGAIRSRNYRERLKVLRNRVARGHDTPVTVEQNTGVIRVTRWGAEGVTLLAALSIAIVSGFFSVTGLTHVFRGAFWPVTAMGVALECAKLAGIAWLGRRHGAGLLGTVMMALVTILMALSAIGSFGFLSSSHISHVIAHRAMIDQGAANIEARAKVQAALLADVDKRLRQIDAAIEETIRRGRAAAAMALSDQLKRNRADLALERNREAQKIAGIEFEAARVQTERDQLAADDGPVSYIADLLGVATDTAMKWFILLVAILLDPLACALLLAANSRGAP
jgi:hypothetical protein